MAIFSVVLLSALMLLVTANVLLRRFTDSGIRGIVEISEVMLVMSVYFAMAVTQRNGAHVTITVVSGFLRASSQRALTRFGLVVAAVYVAVASWEASGIAAASYERKEARFGLLSVPVWPARILVAVGLGLLLLELIRQIVARDRSQEPQDPELTAFSAL